MNLLEVAGLSKNYGEKKALTDVSFSIEKGDIVGLIGKNGAGKSTLLKSIAGLLNYDSGHIHYNQADISQNKEIIKEFGILIECSFLDYISAYDNLRLLAQADGMGTAKENAERVEAALKLVGLENVKSKRVKSYSFGMKQRLGLAQAIISAKSFLMLDEPFIGLDPLGKEIVKNVIVEKAKNDGYAVLFSSHDLDDVAEICDRIIMIDKGICAHDGEIETLSVYHIILKNSLDAALFTNISEAVEVQQNTLCFSDTAGTDLLHAVLKTIYANDGYVERIAVTDKGLTGMFVEGNAHESA